MPEQSKDEFQRFTGVSRETLAQFERYAALLTTWQGRINLVAQSTVADIWHRHFLDSAQIYPLIADPAAPLVDVGSGAGFPGLVLALLGARAVTLVERDQRKAAFLRAVAADLNLAVQVAAQDVASLKAAPRTLTARAWAPVAEILDAAAHLITPQTQVLLLKGVKAQDELTLAAERWKMAVELKPSLTNSEGRIVQLHDIHRIARHGR